MSPVRLDLMGKGLSTYKKMEVEVLSLKFGQAGWGRLVHRRVLWQSDYWPMIFSYDSNPESS